MAIKDHACGRIGLPQAQKYGIELVGPRRILKSLSGMSIAMEAKVVVRSYYFLVILYREMKNHRLTFLYASRGHYYHPFSEFMGQEKRLLIDHWEIYISPHQSHSI